MKAQTAKNATFEATAMPFRAELLGSAMKLTRNGRDAEDLVQETMIKAYTFFDRFEEGTNCRAWLYRIMTNTFINQYRRRVKEAEILGADNAPTIESHSHGQGNSYANTDPEFALSSRQINDRIRKAILALPENFRQVVVLADVQEFPYRDIAYLVDCPVGTVMSRLFRGRRMLQAQLKQLAEDQGVVRVGTAAAAMDLALVSTEAA